MVRKNLFWIFLLSVGFLKSSLQQSCVNFWNADPTNTNIDLCPVETENGEICNLPFTFDNREHRTCLINTPGNNLKYPRCITTSGSWANCKVPTNAVIKQVTTRKSGDPSINDVSLNGGTLVWITGRRFAMNSFSFSPTTTTSNQVYLTNAKLSFSCEIHPDKVTSTQVTCYAPAMPAGKYLVRVLVYNDLIPLYQYEDSNNAYIIASEANTPYLDSISPKSGIPGSIITINGNFKTSCYTRDEDGCSDDAGSRISRIYFGGQICNLIDPVTNTFYQILSQYTLKCRLEGSEINFFNGSVLVSEQYGRSLTSRDVYLISPDDKFYNFRSYPVITSIWPQMEVDNSLPAVIEIGGTRCQVVSFESNNEIDSKLVCKTAPKPTESTDNIGGRGITLIRQNVLTAFNNLSSVQPSSSATKSILDKASYTFSSATDVTVWLKGYFIPAKTSNYKFEITTNSYAKFYISPDENSQSKEELISYGTTTDSKTGTKNLEGGKRYYIEAISSKSDGNLNIAINTILLDTFLTDSVSNLVTNEIQEIEINSTRTPEEYIITLNSTASNVTSEIQKITLNSTARAPFVLSFDKAQTIVLDFLSTEFDIQNALNDLPTIGSNNVTVSIVDSEDDNVKIFTVTFNSDLGDVPMIESAIEYDSIEIIEIQAGQWNGRHVQILIENEPTPLIDIQSTQANIKNSLSQFFGIRCPVSIITPSSSDAHSIFDFEDQCTDSDSPLREIAFCGRCSKNTNTIVNNINSILSFRHLCFAYKTSNWFDRIDIVVYTRINTYHVSAGIEGISDSQWHYTCVDIQSITALRSVTFSSAVLNKASFPSSVGNVLIDAVSVRKQLPLGYEDGPFNNHRRVLPSLDIVTSSLNVIKQVDSSLKISYRTTNCVYNLTTVSIRQDNLQLSNLNITSQASPPVTGSFDLSWNNQVLTGIPSDATDKQFKNFLESFKNFGTVSVQRSKDCSGFKWSIKWITGGDKSDLTIANTNLTGTNPVIGLIKIQDGGAKFYPLLDDILRTYDSKPEVSVLINNIASLCNGSCGFEWLESATPAVDSIDTSDKTAIVITGTGFDTTASNNIVKIGETLCVVQSVNNTILVCKPDNGPVGIYNFTINILGKGLARMNTSADFEFELAGSDFNPKISGVGGGVTINITGTGFTNNTSVQIDSNPCKIVSSAYTWITCIVPSNTATQNKEVDIIISEANYTVNLTERFTYDFSNSVIVTNVDPKILSVLGNEIITITGSNFPVPLRSIKIDSNRVKVISNSPTEIRILSPSLIPGLYNILIPIGNLGIALVETQLEYRFYVSSISPNVGSIRGGSFVTIDGEGFSSNCSLNKVSFNIYDCEVQTCSSSRLTCLTKSVHTVHDITNDGDNNVYGFRYEWDRPYITIKKDEIVSWTWQPPVLIDGLKFKVEQVVNAISVDHVGFSSGEASEFGAFKFQFHQPGIYYYWSGFVDVNNQISFRGVIEVLDESVRNKEFSVEVLLSDIPAQKCSFPFVYNGVEYNSCTNVDRTFNWCSPFPIYNGQFIKCDSDNPEPSTGCSTQQINVSSCSESSLPANNSFRFTYCQVTQITNISPLDINYDTLITIDGSGFSSLQCENEVYIGGKLCALESSSTTSLTCKLGTNSGLKSGSYGIEILVKNIGYAIQNDAYYINFKSVISSISPVQGSTTGGTKILIDGDGFTQDTFIVIGNNVYDRTNAEINYNQITLITLPDSINSTLSVYSNRKLATCLGDCSFEFLESIAPVINSVSPLTVNDSTEITITGQNFVSNATLIHIRIGSQDCLVSVSSETEIKCNVEGLDLGAQNINLKIETLGNSLSSNIQLTGEAKITSLSPSSGSINGGSKLTINGNGFNALTVVKIDGSVCKPVEVKINRIICMTSSHAAQDSILLDIKNGNTAFPNTDINFNYSSALTPVITSISPQSEIGLNSELTINGTGFSSNSSEVHVTIGGVVCDVVRSSDTEIACALGNNTAGSYPIELLIDSKGLAANTTNFNYDLIVSSLSNNQSGVAGGLLLKLNGFGFSENTTIKICNNTCKKVFTSNIEINFLVPQSNNLDSNSDCELRVSEKNLDVIETFGYVKSITPELSGVSPLRGGTGGGTVITISGTNFPSTQNDVKVLIDGSQCDILEISSTEIKCATGYYEFSSAKALIEVYIDGVGLALNRDVFFQYIDLWSSRFTWGGDEPPAEGEVVVIGKSQTVYFDTETPILKGIIILGGSLLFDDNQDAHLRAEYIIITSGGRLQIGTEDKPFLHNAKITMFGSVRSIELPIFGSKVIALREGSIDMHGKPVGVTWTQLGQTANAGSNQITLKEPVIWEVGSEIVIASTGDKLSQGQNEVRKISAVSADKRTLTLDSALAFTHLSVIRTVGTGADARQLEIKAEVGLLSRNVIYQGHNDESWTSLKSAKACPDGFDPSEFAVQTCFLGRYGDEIGTDEFGATIMISGDAIKQRFSETVLVRLSNVELFHVGQAFRLGRYPIHFHMNGNSPSSYVKECSIHESFNRAINIHATNYVTIERNLIYNILGGAYFLEDGIEIGNVFKYNLAVFVKTSSSLLNEDVTPAAFWVTNPNNTYLHNAVAGGSHFGWWYRILDRPDGASYIPDYCPKKISMGRFFNNSVHGVGRFGLWIFPGYYPSVTGSCYDPNPSVAKFEQLTTYRNDKGAEWVMSNSLQFRNFISFENAAVGIEAKQIIFNDGIFNEITGPLIADSIIVGNTDSSQASSITKSGVVIAWDRGLLVKNVTFYNFPDTSSHAIKPTEITGICSFGCGGWTTKFTGLSFFNVMHRTLHRWDWDFVGQDLDGSLTGVTNGFVVSANTITRSNTNCQENVMFKGGSVCSNSKDWIRFAFNNLISPFYSSSSIVTNSKNATIPIQFYASRLTHPKGYMIALEANQDYLFEYTNVFFPVNLSYTGTFYNLYPNQYVLIKHKLLKKPDRVEYGHMASTESFKPLDSTSNNGDWHWNNDKSTLTYIISNKQGRQPYLDQPVNFKAYRCRYVNCVPPVSPALRLPVTSRPANALFWSNISTWTFSEPGWGGYGANGNFRLPQEGESVKIPDGKFVVVDCPIPKLKYLQLDGILELDNSINHKLEADVIFINGGQLIVGWENNPILTDVQIILNGQKDTLNYFLPNNDDSIGGKAIGVYGGLDIHGKPRRPSWTTLDSTVAKGRNTITLKDPVDWQIGESIVITTTSYIVNQSEVVTISAKSADNKTLTLSSALQYEHVAFSETFNDSTTYKISAAVGLLTRNVKVIGAEYANQESDLYGFRILVSDYSTMGTEGPLYYKGYARLSDVEMVHPGQFSRNAGEEYRFGILFSNLDEYNYLRPSYVDNCVFRNGYSGAIGILDSASIPIKNNVIYHTIDFGISANSHSNIIKKNLVISNRWVVSLMPWELVNEKTYLGSISIHLAESAVIEDNFIAGAERIGLLYKGDSCIGLTYLAGKNHSIKNNIIHSTISAVTILPDTNIGFLDCIRISGFTVFKSSHWGIYYQNAQTVHVNSNILVDNQVNIFTQVITPNILDHSMSGKKTFINNNIIVGQSPSFSCTTDIKSEELYYRVAGSIVSYTAGINENAKVGLTWAQFLSGSNNAPLKAWSGIMTYNALDGLMVVENVIFAHFKAQCNGQKDFAVSTNKKNDDGHHPMIFKNIKLFDVDHSSKVWIHRPNIGKINPSDCVDMDCDGLKKNLLNDEDGSFLGEPGSVISQSEFEWGSQKRGLGDFRIPKVALAAPNGTKLPISQVYSHLGIVREEDKCTYQSDWQAYECYGLDYRVLTIESMDRDTETRRLSPVAIVSDNKYLDLINGPQDHGWCFGYTCQKRVSSFMAIVAAGKSYDIYLTSTPPKQLRFRILNADASFKIRLSMYYFSSNRIDVYLNYRFVLPTNGYYDEGKMKFNDTSKNLNSFMPKLSSPSGANLAVRDHRRAYATMAGADFLDFKIAAAIVLKFGVRAITPEAFFEEKTLVRNFAYLLGIDPSRIRQVNIIRESRTKRQTGNIFFELVIFDNPSNQATFTAQDEQSAQILEQLSENVTNLFTTGELRRLAESVLNVSLTSLAVKKPFEANSSEIRVINKISIIREASSCREQSPCTTQPILVVLNDQNQIITGLYSSSNPWKIRAKIATTSYNSELIYETEVPLPSDGFVQFQNLGLSAAADSFVLEYELVPPANVSISIAPVRQTAKECSNAILDIKVLTNNLIVDEEQAFNLTVSIIDKFTQVQVKNISWRNHQWQASINLYQLPKNQPSGVIRSYTSLVEIDTTTGYLKLLDLYLNTSGMFLINVTIRSSNNEYFLRKVSDSILVKPSTQSIVLSDAEPPVLFLKFNKNITLDADLIEIYKAIIYNSFILKYNLTLTRAITLYNNNMANLAFSLGPDLTNLRAELNEGFILYNDAVLIQATLNDEDLSVKDLTVTVTNTDNTDGSGQILIKNSSTNIKINFITMLIMISSVWIIIRKQSF